MTRREMKEATRAGIIAAARESFEAAGYHTVTLRQVARCAGVSTGAIFSNFKGKDELYEAVYGHAPITPEEGRVLRSKLMELAA